MRFPAFPTLLALAAVTACAPAFAQSPDQAKTAHHDTEFLKAANQGSVDEIDLAKFVLNKTSDPDVTAFAQKMIHDHTQLLDDMKKFDMEAGVTIPDHPSVAIIAEEAKLKVLSGKAFDKAYIEEMVKEHHKDLEAFIAEEKYTGYPAFKDAVSQGEQVVRGHLELADQDAKKLGVATAPVPNNA